MKAKTFRNLIALPSNVTRDDLIMFSSNVTTTCDDLMAVF